MLFSKKYYTSNSTNFSLVLVFLFISRESNQQIVKQCKIKRFITRKCQMKSNSRTKNYFIVHERFIVYCFPLCVASMCVVCSSYKLFFSLMLCQYIVKNIFQILFEYYSHIFQHIFYFVCVGGCSTYAFILVEYIFHVKAMGRQSITSNYTKENEKTENINVNMNLQSVCIFT